MHSGNGMEIYWRDNFICPTEKEYLDVICPKTSSAILFGVKVMQLFSNYTENLDTLVILLGQICQIQNDFSSLQLNKQVKVKTFCEDIGEGKFSFPIIHAIQSHPDDNEIMEEKRQFRQNIATANATYSVADALGACVYGTYIEMENMAKIWPFEDFNKTKLIVKPEVEFYRGRGMEIDWMNNAECPTEEELDELQSLCEPRKAIGMHQAVDSIASTINAANYAGCNALEKCLELDHSKAGSIYIEQMMQFYRGLGSEIYWRDNYVCPTEEEYRKMCIRKKGSNYQIAVQLMQLFSTNTCDFTKLTDILAQFFQIYEDYIHLCTKEVIG
ncbi:hypothetical protein GEV33_000636 [Tenebrio molitor]|uniref:Uncharacterized protein n=1 Tax=Tenebrio molitor TaxID=7067 RepID=A0A8J6LHD4_TENMO|nr:hypothetical protein GEV33_000636 [Tenebrio molitor]